MSQWWVKRSSSAVVILGSLKALGHSPKAKLVVTSRGSLVEPADEVEQELAARLSERQIAELVEDHEVHPGQLISNPALPPIAGLGLETIDEIHHVVEPAAGAGADAASGDGDGKMALTGAGRTSVMMPGVWRLKCRCFIHSIRGAARLLSRSAASATQASTI